MFFILSNASNSSSPQQLLQYVAAIPNNIHCTVFLRNANQDIPCCTQPKALCCFLRPNTIFLANWTQYYLRKHACILFRWHFDVLSLKYSMRNTNATSVALFHGLDTITEKCHCSQTLRTDWVKIACAAEQEGWCTVLKVGKSHKPNNLVGIRDFIHAHRTSTHSAISASCVVHSFRHIVTADWWGIKLTA